MRSNFVSTETFPKFHRSLFIELARRGKMINLREIKREFRKAKRAKRFESVSIKSSLFFQFVQVSRFLYTFHEEIKFSIVGRYSKNVF